MFDSTALTDPDDDLLTVIGLPTERLEDEMTTLAGHLAAATCSFLVLVGEFDRRKGYESWELLSTAHWLNWRCGVSLTAAREQVRVARRLAELRSVRAEFAAGRLSYSKVRAITRVANPHIEAALVRMAKSATAAHMDRACAALRRTQDLAAAEEELRSEEGHARARRNLSWSRTDDGDVIFRVRMPAEDAETVIAAITSATTESDTAGGEPMEPLDHRRTDALVDIAAAHLARPEPGEPSTPEIIVHVTPPFDATRGAAGGPADRTHAEQPAADPSGVLELSGMLEPMSWPARTAGDVPLSFASVERLCCDAGIRFVANLPDGTELNLGRHQRTVNRAQRRALHARDKHCRFPGCQRRSRLIAHHIIFWTNGGPTDLENLLLLCPSHHRAVHHGGWTLTGTASDHTFSNPRGRVVDPAAPLLDGSTAELVHHHRTNGRDIALQGAGGRWHGEHIDWDCFFAAFAN